MNMMEAPIYPDIKKGPIQFKNSGKHWTVDVGQTLLDTEPNTQLLGDAVLAVSYRDNIDRYGQSSYQEKIAVFRPPLQNYYEDFGPLNRLPTKIHAITPYMTPGTAFDDNTTFSAMNNDVQEVHRFITDKITTPAWHNSYYMPMETLPDTSVLPDLVTTLPTRSVTSGQNVIARIDAPHEQKISAVQKPQVSAHAGVSMPPQYGYSLYEQSSSDVILQDTSPLTSAHSGYNIPYASHITTRLDEMELNRTLPLRSVTSGVQSQYNAINKSSIEDIELSRTLPSHSSSAGFISTSLFDGKTHLDELEFDPRIETRLNIANPGSEDNGYKTQIESYTSPDDYMKKRSNPNVSVVARSSFGYQDTSNSAKKIPFQQKLQPIKSYDSGLNQGTIHRSGVESQNVNGRFFANKRAPVY
jgi:hypothetical protein